MSRKIVIVVLSFLLFQFALKAQDYAGIRGKVYDAETNFELLGANIVLIPGNIGIFSNEKGEFKIDNIPVGTYNMVVSFIGYNKTELAIELKKGDNFYYSIPLTSTKIKLPAVTIQVKSNREEFQPLVRSNVIRIDIEANSARDIGDFLKKIPNVSGIRKGGTAVDPVIRGFKYDQINVHLDNGIRIEGGCPSRMDPTVSHIEIYDIENIEVIKGPHVLRYGPSLGGIINITTLQPKPFATRKFEIHANGLKSFESNWNGDKEHVQVTGGNKYLYFSLSGGNMEYGNYEDGNGNTVNSKFRRYNYAGKVGFSPNKFNEFIISYHQSYQKNISFPALPMDERDDDTRIMSFDYHFANQNKLIKSVDLKVFRSDVEHLMDNFSRGTADTMAAISLVNASNTGGRLDGTIKLGGKKELVIGTDFEYVQKDGDRKKYAYKMPPNAAGNLTLSIDRLWYESEITNNGFFAQYSDYFNGWDILAALRVDINKATSQDTLNMVDIVNNISYFDDVSSEFTNVSFSLGINHRLNKNLTAGISLGRGVRSPGMLERYIKFLTVGYDKYDYVGNPQLEPEANNQLDLILKYNVDKIGRVTLNAFYAYVTNYISSTVVPNSIAQKYPKTKDAIGLKQFNNIDHVFLRGIEFSFMSPENKKWGTQLIASYTRGTNPIAVNEKTNPGVEISDALPEIPPFEANLSFFYKLLGDKMIPKISVRYVAEQNYVSSVTYISSNLTEQATPSFTLLDFSLAYYQSTNLTVTAGINNIFNKAYYEHLNRRSASLNTNLYEPGSVFFVNMIVKF